MSNIFQGTSDSPQHISVGAVIVNGDSQICCHKFNREITNEIGFNPKLVDDLYLLMRETLEEGETLERAVHRGIGEEFGMKAEIISYVGSLKSTYPSKKTGAIIEKTTLYFLCRYVEEDQSLREGGVEGQSEVVWKSADFLIEKMTKQSEQYKDRGDLDENSIIKRAKDQYLSANK